MKRLATLGACATLIVAAGVARGASEAGGGPPSEDWDAESMVAAPPPAPATAQQDPAGNASTGAGAPGMEPQEARPDATERGHQAWVESIWNSP